MPAGCAAAPPEVPVHDGPPVAVVVARRVQDYISPRRAFRWRTPREVERTCLNLMIAVQAIIVLMLICVG